jgi:hypothetical protein
MRPVREVRTRFAAQRHARRDRQRDVRAPYAPLTGRRVWFGAAALLTAFLIGSAAQGGIPPEAAAAIDRLGALASWCLAHWGFPQPVEASPIVTCGLSPGFLPTW